MRNIHRRFLIIVAVLMILLIVLYVANGTYLRQTYLDPWNQDYFRQFDDPRLQVVAHGLLAPNSHNMQPWKVRLSERNASKFSLYIDQTRLIPDADPLARQTFISQGTFLENVRLAGEELGYRVHFMLFPQGELDDQNAPNGLAEKPVVELYLEPAGKANASSLDNLLYPAIFSRVTTRTPYLDGPLTEEQVTYLQSLNTDPQLSLQVFQSADDLKRIKELAVKGALVEASTCRVMRESNSVFRVNERQKNQYRYGLTMDSQSMSPIRKFFLQSLGTIVHLDDRTMAQVWQKEEVARIARTPAYAMILSQGNSREVQISAGMLYSRLQLAGTTMGISMQPTSQVLQEYPQMENLYQEAHRIYAGRNQTIQMLVRMGRAGGEATHSPRQEATDLLMS